VCGGLCVPHCINHVLCVCVFLYCCRCLEAFCIYGSVGRVEEPYVSITRKRQMPRGGQSEEVERQVGQAEGKLFTHRAAFARTSVIQAFLGSAPQLTLQLYICVLQQGVSIGRGEWCVCDCVCLCVCEVEKCDL
jgi:membrane transport protein XK